MKQGTTLPALLDKVAEVERSKRDFHVRTKSMEFNAADNLITLGSAPDSTFEMSQTFHDQLAARLDIPRAYYNRMRTESPYLLEKNVAHWLRQLDELRFVRTAKSGARAFLSDRYRALDNWDLLEAVMPVFHDKNLTIASCECTERRLYLKVILPSLRYEVKPGDIVEAGLSISNSEIGLGMIKVEPLIHRLICLNGMISKESGLRKYHVGKANDELEGAAEFFRDETRAADDKAFWMKVRDTVSAAFDAVNFKQIVARMKWAAEVPLDQSPIDCVEITRKRFAWSEEDRNGVLTSFLSSKDMTLYGLANAITDYSKQVEDYDRATDFERAGGVVIASGISAARELGFAPTRATALAYHEQAMQ